MLKSIHNTGSISRAYGRTIKEISKSSNIDISLFPTKIVNGICVTETWGDDGNVQVCGVWGPGDIVINLTNQRPYHLRAVSKAQIETNVELTATSLKNTLKKTQELQLISRSKRVTDRINSFLYWLHYSFCQDNEYLPKLTHIDIANALNTTRVTVTRIIDKMVDEGKISKGNKRRIYVNANAFNLDKGKVSSSVTKSF